jgi:uncharacterized membrane protein YphA (DoxX/SURF4 family)
VPKRCTLIYVIINVMLLYFYVLYGFLKSAETWIARGSLPGTTTKVHTVGFPFAEIWSV